MNFDLENKVVFLCSRGMELEGEGLLKEASNLFNEAWNIANHRRHQESIVDKLKWDTIALKHALNINDDSIEETLPSLYLNIGKCYEDLNDLDNARNNYQMAYSYATYLPDKEYGKMIKNGIHKALERISQ